MKAGLKTIYLISSLRAFIKKSKKTEEGGKCKRGENKKVITIFSKRKRHNMREETRGSGPGIGGDEYWEKKKLFLKKKIGEANLFSFKLLSCLHEL